jgi:hypothetical protein
MALVAKPKRVPKSTDKRRAGRHHKRDEHYVKTYWPYIPLLIVVGIGMFANAILGSGGRGVLGYATDINISSLLVETNNQRASNSLGALAVNSTLNQAAQAKANDMAARNYWSHNTPDGQTPWTFFTAAGYQYQTAGENLAYGFDTSTNAVIAWMNSPGHKANILNTTYTEVGFGIANSADYQGTGPETIVVAMYASPYAVAGAGNSAPAAPAPTPAAATPAAAPAEEPKAEPTPEANATPAPVNADDSKDEAVVAEKHKVAEDQPITRIQLIASDKVAPWSVLVVSTIATVAVAIFLLRHGLVWHRVVVKGERFFMKHKLLDIALVSLAVIGVLLTRTVGFIR